MADMSPSVLSPTALRGTEAQPQRRNVAYKHLAEAAVLLAVFYLLVLFRAPHILTEGRFWAEEGTLYYLYALKNGFSSIFNAHLGYYSLWNKIAAYAATFASIDYAPLVTVYFAFLVQYAVILITWKSDLFQTPVQKVAAFAVMVLAFPANEVWLNTINSQFYFALGTAIILASGPSSFHSWGRRGFLLVAGLTGPVSVFLTPFFILRGLLQRDRARLVDAGLLLVCTLLQGSIVLATADSRPMSPDVGMTLAITGVLLGFMPYVGIPTTNDLVDFLQLTPWSAVPIGLSCLAVALGIAVLACRQVAAAWWLALAAIWLCFLSHFGALGGLSIETFYPLSASRYGYAPVALFGLMLVAAVPRLSGVRAVWRGGDRSRHVPSSRRDDPPSLSPSRDETKTFWQKRKAVLFMIARNTVVFVFLALFMVNGTGQFLFGNELLTGPDWREAVAAWRQDPSQTQLPIWPLGWVLNLPKDLVS